MIPTGWSSKAFYLKLQFDIWSLELIYEYIKYLKLYQLALTHLFKFN